MKRILFAILIIITLTGDSFSQRIPFAFWNRVNPDTLELDAPILLSPADDTTGVDQSPLLDWEGVVYATSYIVQLDNDTNFSPISWTDTTGNSKATVELGLIQGSRWYWRVKAFNLFDTSEWSVTYSFTVTTGPALTKPVLTSPADNATNVSQLPVLDWDTVLNVRHYVVQLSGSTSFASIYWSDSLTRSTATVDTTLSYSSTWYWRVIAYNDFDTSVWSDTSSFTVRDPSIAAPTLLTPANAATGQSQSPTLVWSDISNADFYNLQLAQYNDFSTVLWNTNSFDTSKLVSMTLLEGTKWYWRVRSMNATDTSSWSSTFSFAVTEGSAVARAYYVDPTTGKDENNGRAASTPWQSLDKVTEKTFIAGDTILLKGGQTFTGDIRHRFTHDDTVNAMTYGSYGTGKAKIKLGASDSIGINIQFTKHIKVNISDIIIEGIYDPVTETGGAAYQYGIFVWNYTNISPIDSNKISQVNINNCEVFNIKNGGIRVVPGDFGKTITCHIDSNLCYNLGGVGIEMVYNWHSNSRIYGNTIHDVYGLSTNLWDYGISAILCKDVAIERNLIYNIGQNNGWSGIGVITGAAKNIRLRYNEIYGIKMNSIYDGEAIDFENGTDSCVAEYNYIHDTPGMGVLISGGSSLSTLTGNYKSYYALRGSIDTGSCDYNVIRYNVFKNLANTPYYGTSAVKVASGQNHTTVPGKNNQVYNNTVIFSTKRVTQPYGFILTGHNDSTKIFNNIVVGDSTMYMYVDTLANVTHTYVNNNFYWDRRNSYKKFYITSTATVYSTFDTWNAATGWEATKYNYNPLLANPYNTTGDTLNNPFLIETLSKYVPVDGSLTRSLGVTLSSYTRGAPSTDMRGLTAAYGGNYGIGAFNDTSTAYSYAAETKRWIGRMDTLQTADQRKTKDSLVAFMKADTLWSKLDIFYILANLDSGSAKLNILKDTFNLTAVNSPAFTTQRGYTGNGTTSYLNSGWTPSTNAVNFLLDSGNMSVYSLSNIAEDKFVIGTSGSSVNFLNLNPLTSTSTIDGRINQNSSSLVTNTNSLGLFSINRTASNATQFYRYDSAYGTGSVASSSLSAFPLFILARNFNGTASNLSTRQIAIATVGKKLNAYSMYRLTDNLDWYLNSIGATTRVPVRPNLLTPATGEDSVSITATLDWNTINNARSYHIQVDDNSDFSSLIGEVTGITNSQYIVGGSNPGATGTITLDTNYVCYWRVRGVNPNGNSAWSTTYSFSTISSYDLASLNLFARFPNGVGSVARKDLIDSLIKQLKADTIWSKLDLMYLYAAEDTGQAKENWLSSSYSSTLSGSTKPSFVADRGFTGNGTTAYINTNWKPFSNGVNFLKDSSSIFAYVRTAVTEDKVIFGLDSASSRYIRLVPRSTANQIVARYNGGDSVSRITTYDPKGLYSIIRSSASSYKIFKNDSLKGTSAFTSSQLYNGNMYVLARNSLGTVVDLTTRELSFFATGGLFSDYRQMIFHRRIEWYLNRLGAYVFVPSYPILTTPANTATGVSITPFYDWDNVGANYYQIEIDNNSDFSSPEFTGNVSSSYVSGEELGDLDANTTYYWRVRGVNGIGTGAWSNTYSFTTTP